MTAEQALRDRLAEALSKFEEFVKVMNHPWYPWTKEEQADALMPIVREALAAAWDDGWHAGYRADSYDDGINPWREDQP